MPIRTFASAELATVYVAAQIESLITIKPHAVLGLATGSTPIPLYDQLVEFHRQGLSFAQVRTINLDEYVGLPANHPQSYRRFMHAHLFDAIDIFPAHTFIPDGQAPDLRSECQRYDTITATHPIDLQVLGIGRNGHIGFNEPDVSMKLLTHVTQLSPDTTAANARFLVEPEVVPKRAITMGIQSILRAQSIILMAFGEDKAEAVRKALSGEVTPSIPASFLQMHAHVTFVLDQAAASRIRA